MRGEDEKECANRMSRAWPAPRNSRMRLIAVDATVSARAWEFAGAQAGTRTEATQPYLAPYFSNRSTHAVCNSRSSPEPTYLSKESLFDFRKAARGRNSTEPSETLSGFRADTSAHGKW